MYMRHFSIAAQSQCVGYNARLVGCPLSSVSTLCVGIYNADMISISESLIIYTPVHYSNLTGFIYTTWNKNKIKF